MELSNSTHVFFVWPARDEPWVAVVLMLVISLLSSAAGWAADNWLLGVGVWLALLTCTLEMWLPSQTFIDPLGLRFQCLGRHRVILWHDVIEHRQHPRGIRFRTAPGGRGFFLRFGRSRDDMLAVMRRCCPELFDADSLQRRAAAAAEADTASESPP